MYGLVLLQEVFVKHPPKMDGVQKRSPLSIDKAPAYGGGF